ncbi:MAG TPA: flagellar biosynthesis anti-sigma factor FlgM [Bryobacteraceae bacterium]|nr:flagellar biosynthesis anti-sigma factor FlgM [Bryobacteraceae bacterium]
MQPTRLNTELTTGTSSSRAERTTATRATESGNQAAVGRTSSGSSEDQIQLSSLAGKIVQVAGAQAAQRAGRIEELSKIYAQGDYHVQPEQLSRHIVDEWLAGGTVAKSQ